MTELGAGKDAWIHADLVLGLGSDLLPVVPAGYPIAPDSKIKQLGKTPSDLDNDGRAFGLKDWTQRAITGPDLLGWSNDPRLSMCLRTGRSGVYAIDVDIENAGQAIGVQTFLGDLRLGHQMRYRSGGGSNKFLIPIRLPENDLKKRVIKTEHGIIEFLGDGQQFLMAGPHPKGGRYAWAGCVADGLPEDIQSVTLEQFEDVWSKLKSSFAVSIPDEPEPDPVKEGEAVDSPGVLTTIDDSTLARLRAALESEQLRAASESNDVWSSIGYALLSLGPVGRELWLQFKRPAGEHKFTAAEWYDQHRGAPPRSDWRRIFNLAKDAGWSYVAALPEAGEFPSVPSSNVPEVKSDVDPAGADDPGADDGLLPTSDKPIIRLLSGELHHYAVICEEVLADEMYVQGQRLVRIGESTLITDKKVTRDLRQRIVVGVSSAFLQRRLGDRAYLYRYDGRMKDWVKCDCPEKLADNIVNQKTWPHLRILDSIAASPFVRSDGSICVVPGYDDTSGVYYHPTDTFPALPEAPTRGDAVGAASLLLAPFEQFPFADPSMKAAFLAHILTEATRTAVPTSPMFWYTAPNAGTGKTLLAEMPSRIVHGVGMAASTMPGETELKKQLFARALAGDRSIWLDNVQNGAKVRSPTLCAFLTQSYISDRVLGASKSDGAPNRAVVVGTGNNVTPASDLARRSVVIRLDAGMSAPQMRERTFAIEDLKSYVDAHRVELLLAALTIIKAAIMHNRSHTQLLPSFERWSQLVRGTIVWLGYPDPLLMHDDETDDESGQFEDVFSQLYARFGSRRFTAKDISDACADISDQEGTLRAALAASGCVDNMQSVKVGYWLRDARDKVVNGLKLLNHRSATSRTWQLVSTGAEDLI